MELIGKINKPRNKIIPVVILLIGIFLLGIYLLGVRLPMARRAETPTEGESSASVKASGAKISGDEIAVNIPPKSLPVGTKVEVDKVKQKPPLESNQSYVSDVYDIEASKELEGPVVIEIAFDPNKVEKTENLYAAWWNGNEWVTANGVIDFKRNKLIVQTDHLSWWTALYNRISAVWDDKIEPAHWYDVPSKLRNKLFNDLKLSKPDVVAIEHAQFSSATKAATFVIGVANQISDVSGILGGMEGAGELVQAIVEKVAEDAAKKGGGKSGELVVEVYEGFKTGFAAGGVIGHMVFKTGMATAELQSAAPQILGWILEKEMKYINENTSGLFEYLSLYDSNSLDRIDTYIFFYDASASGHFRTKGVVLYYWSPTWKKWVKGKNVATTSDILVKVLEKAKEPATEKTTPPPTTKVEEEPKSSPTRAFRFSRDGFPSNLLGYPLSRTESVDPQMSSYESLSPLEQVNAFYEKEEGVDFIVVTVTKFSGADKAQKGPEAANEWASSNMGHSAVLKSKGSVLEYPFWMSLFGEGGRGWIITSSSSVVEQYVIGVSIEKPDGSGGSETQHRDIMQKVIEAFSKG